MPYRLPPMTALKAFDAAARSGSFRLAAIEIRVTPSAVSHSVAALEAWAGRELFIREKGGVVLTESGRELAARVGAALEILALAAEEVAQSGTRPHLVVSAAPTFGIRWLVPRLREFRKRHPEIEVSVDTSQQHVQFPRDGVDLAVRMGIGDWPNLHVVPLCRDRLVPVCSPAMAQHIQGPADLSNVTPIRTVSVREDWDAWFQLSGRPAVTLPRGIRFDSIQAALEAACQGLGVAIGRLPLAADELRSGKLVHVLGPPVEAATGYWLVARRATMLRSEAKMFVAWLRSEVSEWAGAEEATW